MINIKTLYPCAKAKSLYKNSILLFLIQGKSTTKYAIVLLLILLNSFTSLRAQLSSNAKVSILTCAPGDELYSIFGHSAIRINDPANNIDYVFNYGIFDFNTHNFYLKFLRGQLNYMVAGTTYNSFLYEYISDKRSVWEQVLKINETEKNELFKALMVNAQPENRYYHYHFFFDNCATRIRDMAVNNVLGGVRFNSFPKEPEGKMSYRQAIGRYLIKKPWTKLGLDLILGEPTDDYVDGESIQFLPDYLMMQFRNSTRITDGSGVVASTKALIEFKEQESPDPIKPSLWFWFGAVVVFFITWIGIKKRKSTRWLDVLLFSTTSVIGLLITFLWFFTEHTVTGPNWHILWANPLHLIIVFGGKRAIKSLLPVYFMLLAGILVTMLFFYLFQQYIPMSLLPVWLIIGMRLTLMVIRRKDIINLK